MTSDPSKPKKSPCGSCPYRCDVPSGVWDAEEYDKLPAYDRETFAQPLSVFMCHMQDNSVCSGWLGYKDPIDLLAVRLAVSNGRIAPECTDYVSPVPLFASGQEAADHGKAHVEKPQKPALEVIRKLQRHRVITRSTTKGKHVQSRKR